MQNVELKSNRESGLGRPDILIKPFRKENTVLIIELKTADAIAGLAGKALEALKQIERVEYEEELRLDGYQNFIRYGVAFCKKSCKVRKGE